MELRQAVFTVCLLFPLIMAQSAPTYAASASTDSTYSTYSTSTNSTSTSCGIAYISGCLSTAIVSACGDVYETACACDKSEQEVIASIAGPCLLAECSVTEILAIGNVATSACDQWLSTHLLTTTTAGGFGNTTSTGFIPTSTTFSSTTTPNMSITSTPTIPTSIPTSTSAAIASQGLSVGADVGIGVGVFALVCVIAVLAFVRLRRKKKYPAEAHELQTADNIAELPDQSEQSVRLDEPQMIEISPQDLEAFHFPFQNPEDAPVELDSRSIRAQSRGKVAGTETTAFDFETQKVLLSPELIESRASSRAPGSSPSSLRRHNTDTSNFTP